MVGCNFFGVIMFMLFSAGVTGQYENCTGDLGAIDNGKCDTGNNNLDCGFDGGDCCECSCVGDRLNRCGIWGFNCLDPDAVGGSEYCQDGNVPVGSCLTGSPQTWLVEDTASATSLIEAVNCSGGTFDVIWRGSVVINRTIEIPDGTTVYLTGEGSGAEVNGGGNTRLFKATRATLYINNMILRNGNAMYGGAIATERSYVFINQTSCSGNIASSYGGAVYLGMSSTLVWDGQATLKENHAGRGGGLIVVHMNSTASWDGEMELSYSTTTGDVGFGGAVYVKDRSKASWKGAISFNNNIAGSLGGAFYVSDKSNMSWDGTTYFVDNTARMATSYEGNFYSYENYTRSWDGAALVVNNTATSNFGFGGTVYVRDHSRVSWEGVTYFKNNIASSAGGAVFVLTDSSVSWDGVTAFTNNVGGTHGGALLVDENSIVSWSGITSFIRNYAANQGGAFHVQVSSIVTWDGNTSFIDNKAYSIITAGGAFTAREESNVSWNGVTLFTGNTAMLGGAFAVRRTFLSWGGMTSFIANIGMRGGAGIVYNQSTALWDGITYFIGNTAYEHGGALAIGFGSNVEWTADSTADSDGGLHFQSGVNVSWAKKTSFINNNALNGGALSLRDGSTARWEGETSFTGNTASTNGGTVHVIQWSTITLGGDTNFRQNSAGADGGAIYAYVGHDETVPSYIIVDIDTDVLFEGNICQGNGGGTALIGAVVTQLHSGVTFSENSAGVAGGAVFMSGVSLGLLLESARFILNSAVIGGAVYTTGSGTAIREDTHGKPQENPTTFIGCEFIGNTAEKTGGALDSGAGIDLIVNTSFIRNNAAIGGALRLVGTMRLEGCEFVKNSSDEDEGPGISNDGVITDVSRCTFVENVFNCEPGFYLDYNKTGVLFDTVCKGCDTQCNKCSLEGEQPMCLEELEHSNSAGGNATLYLLLIDSGYWRATTTSTDILACFNTEACLGGVTGKEGYCRKGYEGPYCSVCSEGYTPSFGFVCTKCSDDIAGGIAVTAVGGVVFIFVVIAFLSYMLSGKSEDADRGIVARVGRFIPLNSVKIIIVVWQIITQFSTVVNVVFPSVYQAFLDSVDILNFDLTWVLSAGCIIDTDFHDKLLLATLGPLVGMAILGGTYAVAMHRCCDSEDSRKVIHHKHVSMLLLLTFLIYSTVSSTLFKTFACDDLDDGTIYLRADYRIKCDSSKHIALEIYAGFMVVLYVIAIPAYYGILLYDNREALAKIEGREQDEAIKPFSDLWKPYRPERFYYEVTECIRRVLLTGALVFIYPNTAAQIAVAFMMATFFMIVSEALAPHASPWDTWCSRTGHAIVFMTIFLALLFKVDVSGERASSQKVFESILVAAHAFLIVIVVIEAIAVVTAWRQGVNEDIAPRIRPSVSVSTSAIVDGGTCLEEDEETPSYENCMITASRCFRHQLC